MKTSITHSGWWAGFILAAGALAACGGGGGGAIPATNGTLGVAMTDAPACGFDAVNVTVSKVRVNQSAAAGASDSGWSDITLSPARKINLLNLTNGALEELGQTPLAAGHYSQLRLVLDANSGNGPAGNGLANSVIASGSTVETSLDTPSAVQSGIKLVNEFDVAAGQRVDLVLDFDACKSVVTKGNGKYALKPVVKVVPTTVNGIAGFVSTALLGRHVTVSAQQNGSVVSATVPNASTGEFFLARLAPGNYDVAISADDSATAVIAAVPVASVSSTTSVSTAGAPITLAASLTGSISGNVTLAPASGEAVYVAAKQSFAAGPSVTVKYQGADLLSGAYTLSKLPLAAPYLAQFGPLPLVFAAQAGTTPGSGKYRVDASAAGYLTTSVAAVDITTVDQAHVDFVLTP